MGNSANVTLAFLAKDMASGTIRGLSKTLGGLQGAASKVGSGIAKGLKIGTAAIAGVAAAGLGAAGLFVKGAIEDEAAQRKLIDVLKARGLATKDNLAITDKLIEKGAKLAFTDDDIRAGLSTATQFTNNFTDAQKILATAQDVARAKNISLEKATSIVGKAYQGNTKGLKALGVEVGKGAKGLAVLTAVNAKFAGSAAGYADTTQGRFEQVSITLAELGESIGYALLPIVNDLLRLFIEKGVPIIESVVGAVTKFIDTNKQMISGVIETAGAVAGRIIPVLATVAEFIFTKVVPAVAGFIGKLVEPGGVVDSVGKVVGPILANLIPSMGKLLGAIGNVAGKVMDFVGVLWGGGSGPLAIAVKLIGGALKLVVDILGNMVGAIGKAIDAVAKIGKAIMDSPIGWIIKAIGGVLGGVANFVTGGNTPTLPGTSTGGSGGTGMGGRFGTTSVTATTYIDGKVVASTSDKYLGSQLVAAGVTRSGAR